ncbi:hypothetical protein AAFF_G00216170 [Aldrovandia affinis]|uniref:Uncharacterized protein n=1 Tax=Aldrovandia affinis TaxID=143900 RepID=A0AAD7RJ02_9TELE|nr:hypothetical protein AAFF_G00216170 [Aldrovandia affinis]
MAGDGGALKDINEIKSQFRTREGFYKLLTLSDSQQRGGIPRGPSTNATVGPVTGPGSIPGGGGAAPVLGPGTASTAGAASSQTGFLPPVRVSMVKLQPEDPSEESERVCFNIGRELYFYTYTNIKKAMDLSKPIDKRIYKGTQPTCHDFNQHSASAHSVALIVGFSAGQVQYLDPIKKETSKLFNEERLIDKSKVTCLKWLPKSESLFLASHGSGHLYLYNVEHSCGQTAPQYSLLRQGEGFAVYACKAKSPRNPLLRWAVGEGGLNEFAFSPDGVHLACVGQDGCLRVFHFDSMELRGVMRSYFGGLLCVSWSPDGELLATGGEDDLVTVWSFAEARVVARGHGHRSWAEGEGEGEGERRRRGGSAGAERQRRRPAGGAAAGPGAHRQHAVPPVAPLRRSSRGAAASVTYRFGSVGQDTQFCLWDLTDDVLYPRLPLSRARTLTNTVIPPSGSGASELGTAAPPTPQPPAEANASQTLPRSLSRSNSLPHPAVANVSSSKGPGGVTEERKSDKMSAGSAGAADKEHKRYHSLGNISKSNDKINVALRGGGGSSRLDAARVLGTPLCPRMADVPLLEPLVCKKIAHERLTVLMFMDDCIITACQEGLICTWARPGKSNLTAQNGNSPSDTRAGRGMEPAARVWASGIRLTHGRGGRLTLGQVSSGQDQYSPVQGSMAFRMRWIRLPWQSAWSGIARHGGQCGAGLVALMITALSVNRVAWKSIMFMFFSLCRKWTYPPAGIPLVSYGRVSVLVFQPVKSPDQEGEGGGPRLIAGSRAEKRQGRRERLPGVRRDGTVSRPEEADLEGSGRGVGCDHGLKADCQMSPPIGADDQGRSGRDGFQTASLTGSAYHIGPDKIRTTIMEGEEMAGPPELRRGVGAPYCECMPNTQDSLMAV